MTEFQRIPKQGLDWYAIGDWQIIPYKVIYPKRTVVYGLYLMTDKDHGRGLLEAHGHYHNKATLPEAKAALKEILAPAT